jgi:hypothetical protein
MSNSGKPFNITLLSLSEADIRGIRPTKVLDTFVPSSKSFHPDGLFSVETFGKVGEDKRNKSFSYIDFHIPVFHPVIYKSLCELKDLYGQIMDGKAYAVFDTSLKDFVKSDPLKGQTGFAFFVKHFKDLSFEEREGPKREFNIKLLQKFKANCMMDKLIVMPAGLRDYVIDDNGKPSEDEINTFYRKILSTASIIENVNQTVNSEYLDSARSNIQKTIMEIYNYIKSMMEGKNALILGKFAARKIFNSTRNVISSYIPDNDELHGPRNVSTSQTVVGLYQYLRCILPLAVKHVRDTFLTQIFSGPNSPAILVNKKTLRKEMVNIDPKHYDDWMTYEGLEKVFARFSIEELRHDALEIEGYYMGLLYDDGEYYRFVQDKDELPEGKDPKHLRPISYTELLYLSVYKDSAEIPAFNTRYPVVGYGGVYPSYMYLKTTVKTRILKELGDDWEPTGMVASEFPILGNQFYNSMSVSSTHLARLGADFD